MGLKLATLAYLRRGGRTLMLRRDARPGDYHRGRYNGLGGKFEPGETPEACLAREVREECGLAVEDARLKGVITFPLFDGVDDWYVFVYVVPRFAGAMRPSAEGTLRWVPDAELAELPLWPGDRVFLPWLEGEAFFSASFRYVDGRYLGYQAVFYSAGGAVTGRARGGPEGA